LSIEARKQKENLLLFSYRKTEYINKLYNKIKSRLFRKRIEYKQPAKGILSYINPFKVTDVKITVLCMISVTYAFHLIFVMMPFPGLDTIVSPTNVMIGLLYKRIGLKISLLLCLLFTLDTMFIFYLPYLLTLLKIYDTNLFVLQVGNIEIQLAFIPLMIITGTLIRFSQSMIWFKSLKKWIV
jgi:hypothetical protein